MSALSIYVLSTAAAAVLLYVFKSLLPSKGSKLPLPPGPKPIPVLGNALQLPKEQQWLTFSKWGKEYGPITYLNALGQPIIIVNDHNVAIDLLEKRSGIYSDRPYLAMAGELVGWDRSLGLMTYGDKFREMRRLFHRSIGSRNNEQFWALEALETRKFLLRILEEPTEFREHIRITAGSIILLISHGYRVDQRLHQDPFIKLADKSMSELSLALEPGKWLVDLIPAMKHLPSWFPGTGFKKRAAEWRARLDELSERPYKVVKDGLKSGTAPPSFSQELLEANESGDAEEEDLIKFTAMSLYSGGADTTVSAISTLFLAVTLNPSVALKAQTELDRVVGPDRLPSFSDRAQLPYCDAILKEILRWAPITPTGVPHRLMKEDEYNGWKIPRGSFIIYNVWGITHDENIFPNPNEFNPDRFLSSTAPDPKKISFGYGRRICPGSNLADLSLFISIAMTLHVFDITAIKGEEPTGEYQSGSIIHPLPFKCNIRPRSKKAEQLIRSVTNEEEFTYMPGRSLKSEKS